MSGGKNAVIKEQLGSYDIYHIHDHENNIALFIDIHKCIQDIHRNELSSSGILLKNQLIC